MDYHAPFYGKLEDEVSVLHASETNGSSVPTMVVGLHWEAGNISDFITTAFQVACTCAVWISHSLSPTITCSLANAGSHIHYVVVTHVVFSRPDGILQCGYLVVVSTIEVASVCT